MPQKTVILDTNFLLIPFQFKINIIEEISYLLEGSCRYTISSRTVAELKKIGTSIGKHGMAARLALKLIGANPIEVIQSQLPVDDWIVEQAKNAGAVVCTNDAALRKRLKGLRIKMIVLKSRSKLGFV